MRTVYHNARVYTGSGAFAEAFIVEDGVFTAVGAEEDMLSRADGAEKVDLGGRFVCPGFNDSHMHVLSYGVALNAARLDERTDSLSGMLGCLKQFASEHPPREGGWLRGRGWNQDYFTDTDRMPCRRDLDGISADYPIVTVRACGHCWAVNSKALEIAGITKDTPSPEGGKIGMEDGEPDGRLYDNAIDLLAPFIPVPGREEIKDMLRLACRELNSCGITSAQSDDYSSFGGLKWETVNAACWELEEKGELTVRIYEQANFSELGELKRFMEAGNVTGAGDSMFRIGPLKLLGDGSLGSRTAHLTRPYFDDPGTCGFSLFSPEHLRGMISTAHAGGMQVAVHAIGDACLDAVLDAFEAALKEHPRKDHRHGIVHCQITRPDQLRRIRDLGLHVYAQSVFLDYDNHIVEARVGRERAQSSYNWKTLTDMGVSVSNGSDCPVELPDVMKGIQCAVTRTSLDGTGPYLPSQAFSVEEALDSFTARGAEASFEENVKGKIAPGFMVDFTVLDRDPFTTDPADLHTIKTESCYLGGRRVYAAE